MQVWKYHDESPYYVQFNVSVKQILNTDLTNDLAVLLTLLPKEIQNTCPHKDILQVKNSL
jgi:hypothetical protein